ncbi:MAG: AsnC family transcriptional regulator [Thermodesulfobacteriota bacterium]
MKPPITGENEIQMDSIDKSILNRIQSNFPITARPYHMIARELGLAEEDVIQRLIRLKDAGIVRRIGGNFSPDKLGFVSTLCAARVPENKIDLFTATVNRYPGVTHNYERDNDYNIWFTFIAPTMELIETYLGQIETETGVRVLNLPATRVFKIRAKFDL